MSADLPTSPMQGRRLPDGDHLRDVEPGDYWKPENRPDGEWWIRDPFGYFGRITQHTVTEHEDGTITVEPSILDDRGPGQPSFHGFLRAGVWTW